MRIKPIHVVFIVLIPVLLVSYPPIKQRIVTRLAARRLRATFEEWNSLKFSPITNQIQRTDVANEILRKFTSSQFDQEACSEEVLRDTLMRLLKVFSASDGFNFKEQSGKPDFDNYRQFRGFDLSNSIQVHWGTQELPGRRTGRQKMTPQASLQIRKLIQGAEGIPGNGQNETPEALHLLVWLYAIFDRPMETNRIPQAVCCNGHWIGINVSRTIFCLTNTSPEEFLMRQSNCGVGNEKSSFDVTFPDGADRQLLFSATVQLDCGIESHPVAIALRWHPSAKRWIPIAFAAGSTIDGIRYLW